MTAVAGHTTDGHEQGDARIIHWSPFPKTVIPVAATANDLWFSARSFAVLLSVTTQNISIHLRDLSSVGMRLEEQLIQFKQQEGRRLVQRRMKHYSFDVAHAIALRAKRYEAVNRLVDLADAEDLGKRAYKVSPVKERHFAALLLGSLEGVCEVVKQYRVGNYYVDFYLPREGLAVEYDEHYHQRPLQRTRDKTREAVISKVLGAKFIRVRQGGEIAGLNQILQQILALRSGAR